VIARLDSCREGSNSEYFSLVLAEEAEIFVDEPLVRGVILIFSRTSSSGKIVLVVNHDLGKAITHFDDLILLNTELIASGSRTSVLSEDEPCLPGSGVILREAAYAVSLD